MEVLHYTENTFSIDEGFQIAAKIWGNPDGKPVLALHGWLDNANTFDKIAPLVSEGLYIIAIDMPGHGLSDHLGTENKYYLWDYAMKVLKLIDVLGWHQFSILAHSMGTGVATIIAGSFPAKVTQLVCIDGLGAPFVTNETEVVANFRNAVKQLKIARKTNFLDFKDPELPKFMNKEEAVLDRMDNMIGAISYEASEILIERSLKKVKNGYRWLNDPLVHLTKPFRLTENQAKQFISSMTCDTLIILGKEGMFGKGLFADRIKEFKKVTVHWLPGGHHLHLEKAHKQISILINQFLKQ